MSAKRRTSADLRPDQQREQHVPQLDGNNSYTLKFTPPVTNPATLPVMGSLPPIVNDSQGNPLGFWSTTLYQIDSTQSAAPWITQASVLNTAYSTAAQYGLTPGVPYYVATRPTRDIDPQTKSTTYSFKVSTIWKQQLSPMTSTGGGVPEQGTCPASSTSCGPGPIVQQTNPGGPVSLQWGPIQPVSQLESQQLTSGKLAKNSDGSVTILRTPGSCTKIHAHLSLHRDRAAAAPRSASDR
jgi:hypothetical protein